NNGSGVLNMQILLSSYNPANLNLPAITMLRMAEDNDNICCTTAEPNQTNVKNRRNVLNHSGKGDKMLILSDNRSGGRDDSLNDDERIEEIMYFVEDMIVKDSNSHLLKEGFEQPEE
ncbi:2969_t:CDS:2, partial [Acaulospora morrowiae]